MTSISNVKSRRDPNEYTTQFASGKTIGAEQFATVALATYSREVKIARRASRMRKVLRHRIQLNNPIISCGAKVRFVLIVGLKRNSFTTRGLLSDYP